MAREISKALRDYQDLMRRYNYGDKNAHGMTMLDRLLETRVRSNYKVKCRCHCGKEKIIWRSSFHNTKSCGCARLKKSNALMGAKFGEMTIVKIEKDYQKNYEPRIFTMECKNGHRITRVENSFIRHGSNRKMICEECRPKLQPEWKGLKKAERYDKIQELRLKGYSLRELAKFFDVSYQRIAQISIGKRPEQQTFNHEKRLQFLETTHKKLSAIKQRPPTLKELSKALGWTVHRTYHLQIELYRAGRLGDSPFNMETRNGNESNQDRNGTVQAKTE